MLLGVSKHRVLSIGFGRTEDFLQILGWSVGSLNNSLRIFLLNNLLVDGRQGGGILCLLLIKLRCLLYHIDLSVVAMRRVRIICRALRLVQYLLFLHYHYLLCLVMR